MKRFIPLHTIRTSGRALLLVALLLCLCVPAALARPGDKLLNRPYADQKLWHLGFSVGTHVQDLSFTHNGYITPDGQQWVSEIPDFAPGFCVNVLADLRLGPYFNLRLTPGMYFGSKNVIMRDLASDRREAQDIKSAYVVVPLDIKISGSRLNNTRPFVTTGVMGSFDVSKKRSEFLWMNTSDFYITFGMGCDFYLPFFKLIPEIKFCFGLTDVLRHDRPDLVDDPETFKITQSLKKIKSNMVVINFYFE